MSTALSTIITQARTNWPSDFHSSELTDAVLLRYANDIQREICRSYNFDWMKQTVRRNTADETQTYSLPVAGDSSWTEQLSGATVLRFKRDIDLWLINSQNYRVPLTKVHKSILEDKLYLAKVTGKGIPAYFTIEQGRIWLYKKPDHSLNNSTAWSMNLEFFGYLADLIAGGNNVITNEHPLILEYGITARGYAFAKDWEAVDKWMAKAKEIFGQMVNEDLELQLTGQEEGMHPSDADSIGGREAGIGFLQDTSWYNS